MQPVLVFINNPINQLESKILLIQSAIYIYHSSGVFHTYHFSNLTVLSRLLLFCKLSVPAVSQPALQAMKYSFTVFGFMAIMEFYRRQFMPKNLLTLSYPQTFLVFKFQKVHNGFISTFVHSHIKLVCPLLWFFHYCTPLLNSPCFLT